MPVTIPSPLGSPGRKPRGTLETLLLGLAGSAGQLGLQRLIGPGIAGAQEKARVDVRVEAAKDVAGIEAAAEMLKKQAREDAFKRGREVLGRTEAIEVDGTTIDVASQLQMAFDFSFAASEAGEGDSSINLIMKQMLPPGAADLLNEQETRLSILSAEDAREANSFAVARLIQMGVLQDGAPIFPGASKSLLALIESKDGEKINYFQEGLDFITGRIGDSISGSLLISVGGRQQLNPNPGADAVTVDQAVAEWRNVLERFAPADVVEREIKRLNGNAGQRAITVGIAVSQVEEAMRSGISDEDVRASFAGAFTPVEIGSILTRARRRIKFPR